MTKIAKPHKLYTWNVQLYTYQLMGVILKLQGSQIPWRPSGCIVSV